MGLRMKTKTSYICLRANPLAMERYLLAKSFAGQIVDFAMKYYEVRGVDVRHPQTDKYVYYDMMLRNGDLSFKYSDKSVRFKHGKTTVLHLRPNHFGELYLRYVRGIDSGLSAGANVPMSDPYIDTLPSPELSVLQTKLDDFNVDVYFSGMMDIAPARSNGTNYRLLCYALQRVRT